MNNPTVMGKRSKKRNENDEVEVETGSKRISITRSETTVSNEIISDTKRNKKIQNTSDGNQIELNENTVKIKNKRKNMDANVSSENQDLISSNLKPKSNTRGGKFQQAEGIYSNKQKSKKRKQIITTEIDEHSSENNTVISSKKSKKKKLRETVTKEVNKSEEPVQEALNINSKIIKKKKKNTTQEDEQYLEQNAHNDNNEKPKKKKKRKTVEQETVDDKEIGNIEEEPVLETLGINSKIIKKKKKNTSHGEGQHLEQNTHNGNKETPKKKKRKVVEQETVDDEEIDKFCDELDEFHNQQYENWVKLIEKSLNKK